MGQGFAFGAALLGYDGSRGLSCGMEPFFQPRVLPVLPEESWLGIPDYLWGRPLMVVTEAHKDHYDGLAPAASSAAD